MNTRTYVALLQGNPKICFKTDRWCYVILFEIHCSRYLLIIISTQKSSKKLLEKSKQRIFLPHSVSTLECKRHMAKASASSCRQCLKLKSPLQQVSTPVLSVMVSVNSVKIPRWHSPERLFLEHTPRIFPLGKSPLRKFPETPSEHDNSWATYSNSVAV